jgi:anti-sigma B factor antagonist
MEFSVTALARGDRVVIEVRGRLDAESASELRRVVLENVRRATPHVVVDLSAVTFLDSHGVDVLVGTRRLAELFDGSVRIVCRDRRLLAPLRAADLDASFDDDPVSDDQGPADRGAHGHR